MKSLTILVFACLAFAGCTNGERQRLLTMADVHFPDPEREAIVRNHICEIVGYDTLDIFLQNPKARKLYMQPMGGFSKPDILFLGYPLEYRNYDADGRRIFFYQKDAFGLFCATGIYPHTSYDSFGFISYYWRGEEFRRRDTFWYFLLADAGKLGKVHRNLNDTYGINDTTIYTLNNSGLPVLETNYNQYWRDSTLYQYSRHGLVSTEEHIREFSDPEYSSIITTHYYYSDGHLDSQITRRRRRTPQPWINYRTDKTYYDDRGLPKTGIIADTLHVYYVLKQCGDTTFNYHEKWE